MRTALIIVGVLGSLLIACCGGCVVMGLVAPQPSRFARDAGPGDAVQIERTVAVAPAAHVIGDSNTRSGVTVRLNGAWIENPAMVNAAGEAVPNDTGATYLVFRGTIETETSRNYKDFATAPNTGLLISDSLIEKPASKLPDGIELAGSKHDVQLGPSEQTQFAVAFDLPTKGESLSLQLDGSALSLPDEFFSFTIPWDRIQDTRTQ